MNSSEEEKKKEQNKRKLSHGFTFNSFYTFTRNPKHKRKERKVKAKKRGKNIYLLIICALDINVLLFYCAFLSIHLPSYPFFVPFLFSGDVEKESYT